MKPTTINGMTVPSPEHTASHEYKILYEAYQQLRDYYKTRVCVNCKFLDVKTKPSNPWCAILHIGMSFHDINPESFSCAAFEEKK